MAALTPVEAKGPIVEIERKEDVPAAAPVQSQAPSLSDPEKAKAQQEMFVQGAQSGGVARPNPVVAPTTAEIDQAVNQAQMRIFSEVVRDPELLMMLVQPQQLPQVKVAVTDFEQSASVEERALFTHQTVLIETLYTPQLILFSQSVPVLKGVTPETLRIAIQKVLLKRMPDAITTIRGISPEYLANLVRTAEVKEHINKLGLYMTLLESVDGDLLQDLVRALEAEDPAIRESFFIAHSDNPLFVQVHAFLTNVPQKIAPSIFKGLIAGINEKLKK